jgi:hypothetical protein
VKPSDPVTKTVGRCMRDFKAKFNGIDLWKNINATRAIHRLESRCAWAHAQLAVVPSVKIELDYLYEWKDYHCKIARNEAYAQDSDWSQCRDAAQIAPGNVPADQWAGGAPNNDDTEDTFSEISSPEEQPG